MNSCAWLGQGRGVAKLTNVVVKKGTGGLHYGTLVLQL